MDNSLAGIRWNKALLDLDNGAKGAPPCNIIFVGKVWGLIVLLPIKSALPLRNRIVFELPTQL